NADIWFKQLPGGRSVQITKHQSEDLQPVWSPDGDRIAFVSKRRDALGDIWLVSVDTRRGRVRGKPIQLTRHLGFDQNPSFSPDGERLVFCSDRDGSLNLWIYDLLSGAVTPLTVHGGLEPSWSKKGEWVVFTSYRYDMGGDLCLIDASRPESKTSTQRTVFPITWEGPIDHQPRWSPDGREIVFMRYDRDTNGDSRITPDDNASIWKKLLNKTGSVTPEQIVLGRDEIQLTTEVHHDFEPCWCVDARLLFASNRGGGLDCWQMPANGLFSETPSAQEQYMLVLESFGELITDEALYQSILGYKRVEDYFLNDSLWVARSLIQMGEVYRSLERYEDAKRIFQSVIDRFSQFIDLSALAKLKIVTLGLDSVDERIESCRNIIESVDETSSIAAEAWILLGDLYLEQGERGQAFIAYGRLLETEGRVQLKPLASLKLGELLQLQGQEDAARQQFLNVQKEYADVPIWRKRASERILSRIQSIENTQEKIRAYQLILNDARGVPSLAAEVQLAIGRTLFEDDQYDMAERELEIIPT
ncbi:hypothetical protein BVY01_00665, partial [bacterium I07]